MCLADNSHHKYRSSAKNWSHFYHCIWLYLGVTPCSLCLFDQLLDAAWRQTNRIVSQLLVHPVKQSVAFGASLPADCLSLPVLLMQVRCVFIQLWPVVLAWSHQALTNQRRCTWSNSGHVWSKGQQLANSWPTWAKNFAYLQWSSSDRHFWHQIGVKSTWLQCLTMHLRYSCFSDWAQYTALGQVRMPRIQ